MIDKTRKVFIASCAGSDHLGAKTNEDCCGLRANSICLCDGHGPSGGLISAFTCNKILDYKGVDETAAANNAQLSIAKTFGERARFSGCTGVWVRREENCLVVSNVGDSRCVVVNKTGEIIFETRDHKPDDEIERRRIEGTGRKITETSAYDVARIGGLALSRSFGDFAARKYGIVGNPDIERIPLSSIDFVVLGSDGIWDVASSKEVVEYINIYKTRESFVVDLVQICVSRWMEGTGKMYCDDVTMAVWLF